MEKIKWNPPEARDIVIKKDRHSKSRSGQSTLICISCSQCDHNLAIYQKDGRPNQSLIRLYTDRLKYPAELEELNSLKSHKDLKELTCSNKECGQHIASPMQYIKNGEDRPAYRIIRGSLKKNKYE